MKESALTNAIMKRLRAHGGFWIKIHGGASQVSGIPDIIGCYRGRFIAMEVKRPGAELVSPRQRLMLERISEAKGTCGVITRASDAVNMLVEIDAVLDSTDESNS